MMMALGMFIFSLPTLAYQELQRQTDWRHPSSSRVGTNPASGMTFAVPVALIVQHLIETPARRRLRAVS